MNRTTDADSRGSEEALVRAEIERGSFLERLAIAAGVALFCHLGFFGLHHLNAAHAADGAVYWNLETRLDAWIPFDARWIWLYLSYYPGCFLAILAWPRLPLLRQVALGYVIEFGVSVVSFALIPARMAQPAVTGDGWNEWAVRKLYEADPGFNIFPSLHVANALLVAAICARISPWLGRVTWVWALGICATTVLVKQHYVIDIFAGALLAWAAIRVSLVRWDGLLASERARLAAALGGSSPAPRPVLGSAPGPDVAPAPVPLPVPVPVAADSARPPALAEPPA